MKGFGQVQLMIVAAVIGLLAIGAVGMYWHGVNVGRAEVKQEWQAAALKAEADLKQKNAQVEKSLMHLATKFSEADHRANETEIKLKEAKRAAIRDKSPLGSCVQAAPGGSGLRAPASTDRPGAGDAPRIYLRWLAVGLHDAAFTGIDGQPLFKAAAEHAFDSARANTDSHYTLSDIIEVSNDNAEKFSACRRDVAKARAVVEEAAKAWDAQR